MDQWMTAWLTFFNVFVLLGLTGCNLTASITSLNTPSTSTLNNASFKSHNNASVTSLDNTSTTSLNNTSFTSASNYSGLWPLENYQQLIDLPTNEAKKLFYVSSSEEDSFSQQFKLAVDQIYFLGYNVSQICYQHIKHISDGIHRGDHWALAFLDSQGQQSNFKSINNVKVYGSLEQCETINARVSNVDVISGKYVTMSFLTSFGYRAPIDLSISWCFCLPISCTVDDYSKIAKAFEDTFGLYDIDIYISKPGAFLKDIWYWTSVVTLSTLAFICVLATGFDCLYTYCLTKPSLDKQISINQQEEEESILIVTKEDDVMKRKQSFYLDRCRCVLISFSLRHNLRDILKTSSSEGDIGCLHGLRVLSIMWVIFGHVSNSLPELREPRQHLSVSKHPFVMLSYSAPYAVDSFFLMSGCLVSYLFIKTVNRVGQLKPFHMAMYYIHRYIRLTPLYLLTIMIYTGVLPTLVSGVAGRKLKGKCDNYWWRNILYISNFFTFKDMCISWSWYLSNDMQFYVIAPIVTVPIVYGFHKVGLTTACLLVVCHIGASIFTLELLRSSQLSGQFNYMTDFYTKPWNRIGPYAIGLAIGHLLNVRPTGLRINKIVVLLGWISCTALCLGLVLNEDYSSKVNFDLEPNLQTAKKRAFEIVKSPLWALGITWIILACHYGYGGFLNTFLTWKAWIPLSKLTYGTYLCHKTIITYFNLSGDYGIDFYFFYLVERFVYITALTYVMSLILSLLIEIPTRNLLNTFQKFSENIWLHRLVRDPKAEH